MTELLTAAQMRAIEEAAIASGEVTGLELMERAGRGVVEAIFEEWPELRATSHRAVVLCGPGNNGGDGFVVARLLKEWGWEVEVFLYGDPEKLPPDARVNYERWREMGEVESFTSEKCSDALFENDPPNLVIDALFGTGLTRPPPSEIMDFMDALHKAQLHRGTSSLPYCVSVDLPSGICSDSGKPLLDAVTADLTTTFHREKIGHMLNAGPACSGRLKVCNIGLDVPEKEGFESYAGAVFFTDISPSDISKLHRYAREPHKYSHGHALILSGPPGRGGAARLSARGALRIGAGLVTVGCPHEALPENAARLDAVMLVPVHNGKELSAILSDARINTLCLGPGMGTGAREAGLVAVALSLPARSGPPPPSPPHRGEGGRLDHGAAQDDAALPLPPVGRGEGRGAVRRLVLDADALTILSQT
ncbi:NAD(P)H-hydrate epimerase, partial [Tabrizicola sp.]|uniref:NAD(P)H-hydrate epimerase n=1 Tax=Tabrizicola sp. TaxID=2005166 RepID=UPI003F405748